MLFKNRSRILKTFDSAAADLRSLLRARPELSEAEQLFIENRLMMLQIEYTFWAKEEFRKEKNNQRKSA